MNASSADGESCKCHETITIPPLLGLNFDVLCDCDLYGHDLQYNPSVTATTIQKCVDACNRRWGCFGVTYVPSAQQCYLKGSASSISDKQPKADRISVLPKESQLKQQKPKDIICPYPNLSEQQTIPGLNFTILCGASIWGDDLYNPDVDKDKPIPRALHADSLGECMENCANYRPLCSRVTYESDKMTNPWLNCWLKIATRNKPYLSSYGMRHSAYAILPTVDPVNCKDGSQFVADNKINFKYSCFDYRGLNDLTKDEFFARSHETNIDNCVQKCAKSATKCASIAFDEGLQDGYRNCYLFESIPKPGERRNNYTFAYMDLPNYKFDLPPPRQAVPSTKPWIAAVVLMPVSVIVLIFVLWWVWFRKHDTVKKYEPVKGD